LPDSFTTHKPHLGDGRYKFKRAFEPDTIASVVDSSDPSKNKFSFKVTLSGGLAFEGMLWIYGWGVVRISDQLAGIVKTAATKDEWIITFKQVLFELSIEERCC